MSEASLWTLLRTNLPITMYRVENKVSSGMPDIHYVGNNFSGWIELKYIKDLPVKGKINIGLSRSQHLWHSSYNGYGGKSWIIVRIGRFALLLFNGKYASKIVKRPNYSDLEKCIQWGHWGNMKDDQWKNLAEEIKGEKKDRAASRNVREC